MAPDTKSLTVPGDLDRGYAEKVSARAIAIGALSYKAIASIIANRMVNPVATGNTAVIDHRNLRGPGYFH